MQGLELLSKLAGVIKSSDKDTFKFNLFGTEDNSDASEKRGGSVTTKRPVSEVKIDASTNRATAQSLSKIMSDLDIKGASAPSASSSKDSSNVWDLLDEV